MRRTPDLQPFRGPGLVIDVPVLIGLEAAGSLALAARRFHPRWRIGPRAKAELAEWQRLGVAGASVAGADLPQIEAALDPTASAQAKAEVAGATSALAKAWARPPLTEARAASLASAFAVAGWRGYPFISNALDAWRTATRLSFPHGMNVVVVGTAELALYLVACHDLTPEAAWDLYVAAAASIAEPTPGWVVPRPGGDPGSRATFLGWAREAEAGRL